jgi:hypothetical protein
MNDSKTIQDTLRTHALAQVDTSILITAADRIDRLEQECATLRAQRDAECATLRAQRDAAYRERDHAIHLARLARVNTGGF